MTLFDSFGKPSWQHRDPEVRRAAVDDIEDESVLVSLIKDDPDEEVRSLALVRITNEDVLENLVRTLPSPLLEQAKKQWLGLLLPDPGQLSSMTDEAVDVTVLRIPLAADFFLLVFAFFFAISDDPLG